MRHLTREELYERIHELETAAKECRDAICFYNRVVQSSADEQIPVGTDHVDWVFEACRKAGDLA